MNKFRKKLVDNKLSTSLLNLAVYSVTKKDIAKGDFELTNYEYNKVNNLVEKICNKNIPAQYICGYENFYSYFFEVNSNVLIPRFETEELVEKTISEIYDKYEKKSNLKILDLCTGSGCIATVLYKKLYADYNIKVYALDISKEALNVAKKNFDTHSVDINILEGDFTNYLIDNNMKFDVIVTNPPYIDPNDNIDSLVKDYEPNIALFAPNEGYYYYKKLLDDLKYITYDTFLLMMEIGVSQGEYIKNYSNYECIVYKDIFARERIIKICI